ncbi:hypothetical protein AB0M54_15705 [Actinoplanes sp. NPDC051470]|uniref:hypothetical protein n=1 Tax=Actinoplanes sp. NPDC051470 TaxID=3157224 RepID=UPI00342990DF
MVDLDGLLFDAPLPFFTADDLLDAVDDRGCRDVESRALFADVGIAGLGASSGR